MIRATIFVLLLLAGCGGGGGSVDPTPGFEQFAPRPDEQMIIAQVDEIMAVDFSLSSVGVWLHRDLTTPDLWGLIWENYAGQVDPQGRQPCTPESRRYEYFCLDGIYITHGNTIHMLQPHSDLIAALEPSTGPCWFTFHRFLRLYVHERLHTVGYQHRNDEEWAAYRLLTRHYVNKFLDSRGGLVGHGETFVNMLDSAIGCERQFMTRVAD